MWRCVIVVFLERSVVKRRGWRWGCLPQPSFPVLVVFVCDAFLPLLLEAHLRLPPPFSAPSIGLSCPCQMPAVLVLIEAGAFLEAVDGAGVTPLLAAQRTRQLGLSCHVPLNVEEDTATLEVCVAFRWLWWMVVVDGCGGWLWWMVVV